jgi:phosphoribosylformylglycinamidine synthase
MRVAVLRFPGSNCDMDTLRAAERAGGDAYFVWHRDTDLRNADAVLVPGGFAYGDYLRAGAIARFSPVMESVVAAAGRGTPVLGICNGFQILCEAGLLDGALVRNAGLKFLSRPVEVRIEATDTPFTTAYDAGDRFHVPVAHGEGRFVASEDALERLEGDGRVVLRYVGENPNGSLNDIAGIANAERNVVGMMPHPERAAHSLVGETRGATVFESMMQVAHAIGGSS